MYPMAYNLVPLSALALEELPSNIWVRADDTSVVWCLETDCPFPVRTPQKFVATTNTAKRVRTQPRWCACTSRDSDEDHDAYDVPENFTAAAVSLTCSDAAADSIENLGAEYYAVRLRQALRYAAADFPFHVTDQPECRAMARWMSSALKGVTGLNVLELWAREQEGTGKASSLLDHDGRWPVDPAEEGACWVLFDHFGRVADETSEPSTKKGTVAAIALATRTAVRTTAGVMSLVPRGVVAQSGTAAAIAFDAVAGDDAAVLEMIADLCQDAAVDSFALAAAARAARGF